MLRAAAFLLFPGSVLAHPGHGALEVHWHLDDIGWALLGAAVVAGIVFFLRRKSRR
jgi:LPXTG-motif cell wall-anchored protein